MIDTIPVVFQAILGRPIDNARSMCERLPMVVRVVEHDGQILAVTSDYRPDRVNVKIRAGVVASVEGIY